ncbi:MAG: YkgJ family cysteine cluster protein [Deltaproteobacteria bacterium]|nr:YkgJ family cysteine cluster protein [Deltaproteobacteria bacterium]
MSLARALADLRRRLPWRDKITLAFRRTRRVTDTTNHRAPDCARCTDHCCKAPHDVALRLDDVARLIDAGHRHAITEEQTLKKNSDGTCVFLDANIRCTIYDDRPLVCRRFPYFVDDRTTLRYASTCRSHTENAAAASDHKAAAIASYNARVDDLVLIRRRTKDLSELGLIAPSSKDRFEAARRR